VTVTRHAAFLGAARGALALAGTRPVGLVTWPPVGGARVRAHVAVLLVVVAVLAPAARASATSPPPEPVRFLQANVGNINVAPGACNDQAVKLCLAPVEQRLQQRLAELAPHVVALQEVLPGLVCAPPAKPGDFGTPATSLSLLNPQHLCSAQQRAQQTAPDQIDRLLPPDDWDTRCNAPLIDPAAPERVIPPWDCVGVRRDRGQITAFRTLPGSEPGVVPDETCDNGFTVNLARLVVDGTPLQVTSAHPDSGGARDGCRAEKLQRMFDGLGGGQPPVPTVVAGDMNLDPYRTSDASTDVWNRHVSNGIDTPYRYRSGIGEAEPPPFSSNICGLSQEDPTGLVLDVVTPPAALCASTLDHVATTPDLTGPCDTLGEAPGDSARIDGGGGMDHRGIFCTLRTSLASPPFAGPPAPPAAAPPPPAGTPAAGSSSSAQGVDALPATGPPPTSTLGAVVLLACGAALRRRCR